MDKKAQKLVMICSFSLRSAHLVIFSKKLEQSSPLNLQTILYFKGFLCDEVFQEKKNS